MLPDVAMILDHIPLRQRLQLFLLTITVILLAGTSQAAELSRLSEPASEVESAVPAHVPMTKDRDGLWRDTGILVGAQVAAIGVLYMMPESVSGWSPQQKRNGLRNYEKNVQSPGIDNDKFYINYVLHPYWGAAYYTRARERGFAEGGSFLYSAAISTLYEYGVECFFEKPSIQDLFVTPVVGSVIGKYLFEPVRMKIKQKEERDWYDKALLVATDPIGVLSNGIEKMFGIKSQIEVNYALPAGNPRVDVLVKFQLP